MKEVIKILIVDDDREYFLITQDKISQIKNTSYTVDWEPDYFNALTRISQQEHDVYIIDYNLGTYSGIDLVTQCINSGIHLPFIFLTGMDNISTDIKAMSAGAVDYLVKNKINADIIERSIRYAIKQKRTETELIQANATKDKLFSIIGHDLRSPILTLMNSAEMLSNSEKPIDDTMKNILLKELSKSSKQTYNLLENLLSWSRTQIGSVSFRPENFDLSDKVNDIFIFLKPQTKPKSIELVNRIDSNTEVYDDINMVEIIIRNLISNAIKFTKKLGRVEVGCSPSDGFLEIYVKDNT